MGRREIKVKRNENAVRELLAGMDGKPTVLSFVIAERLNERGHKISPSTVFNIIKRLKNQ